VSKAGGGDFSGLHLQQAHRPGDRDLMPFKYPNALARVEANSTPIPFSGCRIWTGRTITNRSGKQYGVLNVRWKAGRRKGRVRTVLAHRYVLAAVKGLPLGKITTGMHLCDCTLCVLPAHLRSSTQRNNVRDYLSKQRAQTPC
jgi:hypothetical protein